MTGNKQTKKIQRKKKKEQKKIMSSGISGRKSFLDKFVALNKVLVSSPWDTYVPHRNCLSLMLEEADLLYMTHGRKNLFHHFSV